MNFLKLHRDGKPILVNLDNVTDIHSHTIATEGKCTIYFTSDQSHIDVDETFEQIQKLIT